MAATDDIVRTVLGHYPDTQAIYLFGSYGTENEWPDSDVDIALLLPPEEAKASRMLAMSPLCSELGSLLGKVVDLINLREVSTVFQNEIITADRRIYTGDAYGADEFEMLALSFYQKLGEERREILEEFWRTGRAYRA
ncbi:MAG: nucleotidyltransferase domain-containing protein [Pseudomonadota bacterium]|nr:nucleotidyltransferase domain-containing protein [Gammaproteobacteria bacterium]MDQ3583801.1 nucleotidyltransferase domain-containing protein [Pseudomonadota bacterium]